MQKESKERSGFRQLGTILVVIPLAAVIWLIMSQARPSSPQGAATKEATTQAETEAEPKRPEPEKPAPLERSEPRHEHHEGDVALASAKSEFKPGDPSHPMSPERARIYRQNRMFGQIEGAILAKDYEGIRRLNAEYRREYPDDDQMAREGYDLVADCFERKTPERVERAREYYEKNRGSRARKDVRKACLE